LPNLKSFKDLPGLISLIPKDGVTHLSVELLEYFVKTENK
jgi:hypothetical protein